MRINLDEVEKKLENEFSSPVACLGNDDLLTVLMECDDMKITEEVKRRIIDIYNLHHTIVKVRNISKLPVTESGKKDYKLLKELYVDDRS